MAVTAKNIFKVAMIVQGLLWIGFVVYGFLTNYGVPGNMYTMMMILMFLNGMIFIGLGLFIKSFLPLKILTVLFLAVNLVLTFTDQMGLFDYTVLVLNVVSLLSFLLAGRKNSAVPEKRTGKN